MLSATDIIALYGSIVATGVLIVMIFNNKRNTQPEKEVSKILSEEVKSLREDVNVIKAKIPVDQELKRQQFEEMKSQNNWNRLMGLGKLAKDLAPFLQNDNEED